VSECSELWCKSQPLKKVVEKYLVSLIFVDAEVKNNPCSNMSKAKQFLFVIGKLSGQFFIFKQDHCKAKRAHKAINLFACNFAIYGVVGYPAIT